MYLNCSSQMRTFLESLTKQHLGAQYKKAEKTVGRAVVDGWESDMRDKITMYSSGGSFFIRRAFKYFDRDGSVCSCGVLTLTLTATLIGMFLRRAVGSCLE